MHSVSMLKADATLGSTAAFAIDGCFIIAGCSMALVRNPCDINCLLYMALERSLQRHCSLQAGAIMVYQLEGIEGKANP